MNNSSPYLNFDFQKKIIADASELGLNLNWMVSRGLCYKQEVNGKIKFVLKKRMKNEKSVYKLFKKVNNKKEINQRRKLYSEIREQESNKQPAIDICLATKKNFGGGFAIHVSNVLTEMSEMTPSEIRDKVAYRMQGPCTPETSEDES